MTSNGSAPICGHIFIRPKSIVSLTTYLIVSFILIASRASKHSRRLLWWGRGNQELDRFLCSSLLIKTKQHIFKTEPRHPVSIKKKAPSSTTCASNQCVALAVSTPAFSSPPLLTGHQKRRLGGDADSTSHRCSTPSLRVSAAPASPRSRRRASNILQWVRNHERSSSRQWVDADGVVRSGVWNGESCIRLWWCTSRWKRRAMSDAK